MKPPPLLCHFCIMLSEFPSIAVFQFCNIGLAIAKKKLNYCKGKTMKHAEAVQKEEKGTTGSMLKPKIGSDSLTDGQLVQTQQSWFSPNSQ